MGIAACFLQHNMEYFFFLSSLEVNSSKHFFNSQKIFSSFEDNNSIEYFYEIITYPPSEKDYEVLATVLDINNENFDKTFKYLTYIPIQIKLQKEYFRNLNKLEIELAEFINNFLTLHQYFSNDYGITAFKLDGRKILHKLKIEEEWNDINYTSLSEIDFFIHIQESIVYGEGSTDLISMLAAKKTPLEFNWTLLIDGIKSFYEGNFRQTLINCCTSLEVTITESIKLWLQTMTFTNPKDSVNQLLFEISNPLKFEFYLRTINPEPYKIYEIQDLRDMLANLKSLNTLRNNVAHQGYRPSTEEAKKAIESTSMFLTALWVYQRPAFYNGMKKR